MAEGGGAAGGAGSEYRLSATLEMRDQLSGKLRSAVSQIKSVDGAVSKLGRGGEVARLAKQLDALNDLRQQVNQFKELKKSVAATQQAYNQANSATAELARQYKQGQSATAQLKAKQAELQKVYEQSQSATSQLKSKLGELKAEAVKAKSGMAEGYDKLQAKIQSTQSASAQLKSKLGDLRAEAAKAKKSGATEEYKNLQSQIISTQSAAGQLKTQLGNLKSEAAKVKSGNASEAYKNLQAQIKSTSAELKASQAMTQKTGAELKSLASGIKQAERELGNIGSSFDQSKKKAAQLKQELKSQQPALSQMRQGLLSQGFNTRDFINSDRQLRERMATATRDLRTQQLRETLSAAGMKLSGGNVNVNVNGNATSKLGAIRKELQSITQKTWNVAVNAQNAVGGRVNEFANGAMLGMGAQMLGTAGMGYGVVDAVKTYKDFEYEMKTVSAITGAYRDTSGQRLAELTELAKHYGETTMFKASEVASAEKYAAMAGWGDEYIKAGLKPMLDLATAAGEDLKRTSDIVTDAMTAFHLKPEEMYKTATGQTVNATEHFADVMAALATSSNTDVNMAGESAKYSAAIIGAMYGSQSIQDRMHGMEDWAVFQGLMADTGIKGSMSGTATRSIFTRLASMQMNADAARDILGVDLVYKEDDAEGHQAGQVRRSLDIIGDLRKKFQGGFESAEQLMDTVEYFDESGKRFTKQQRRKIGEMLENAQKNGGKMTDKDMLALTNMLSGQEALSGMLALITADDETWNKKIAAIQNAHGRVGEMAEVKMDTLEGDLKTLGSAFEAFQLELMTGSGAEGLRSFTQGLTEDIRAFKKSLEDGFDLGDIGSVMARVVTQLKNKFLEFDGVGSILAGGALFMGLKKIFNLTMQLKNAAMTMKEWYRAGATTSPPVMSGKNGAITSSVGSMVIHANSVVVNGKGVTQGAAGTATGGTVAGGGTSSRGGTPPPTPSRMSRFGNALKIGGAASLLTAAFSIADTYSTRSINENRMSEAQTAYEEAQQQYQIIAEDSERSAELPQATENLNQASADLKAIQKEAAKHNNESFFGGMGAVGGGLAAAAIGTAILPGIGTLGGFIVGTVGSLIGAEVGKKVGENFDFDVLGWLMGKNDKTPSGETPTPKADWKLDDGRMYSQLTATERIQYNQRESETEKARHTAAETEVAEIQHQQYEADLAKKQAAASQRHRQDATKEEIESQTAKYQREEQQQRNALIPFAGNTQAPVVASMYGDQNSREVAKITNGEYGKVIDNEIDYIKSLFTRDKGNEPNHLGLQQPESTGQRDHLGMDVKKPDQIGTDFWSGVGDFFKSTTEKFGVETNEPNHLGLQTEKPANIQDANKVGTDFWSSIGDFFKSTAEKVGKESNEPNHLGFQSDKSENLQDANKVGTYFWSSAGSFLEGLLFNKASAQTLYDEGQGGSAPTYPQLENPQFAEQSFNISDMLPDFSLSEWLSEKTANIDLTSILPDFSTVGDTIGEQLNVIPEKISEVGTSIGETFSQIPTAATEAFNTISTSASEGLTSIQTAWNELPSFFDGLFAGLGSVATSAGAAIASGINSAIGTIQSAWESLSSWLSSKISSLASMASSAASTIMSFGGGGGVGHNATGTASWRGGFTEVNEQGGEIIDLPSGARIYPHATTMKMLQSDLKAGRLDEMIQSSGFGLDTPAAFEYDALGNIKGYSGMADNLIQEGDLSSTIEAKLQAQREFMSLSAFPQEFQAPELSAFPQAIDFEKMSAGFTSNSTSNSTTQTNTNNNGITITGNNFNIRKESDLDEIAFRLFNLMFDSEANFGGA